MLRKLLVVGVVTIGALLLSSRVEAACTISTTSVSFGTYNVFSASPTDSTGGISFRCGVLDFNVSVSLTQGQSGTFFPRAMRKGSESLPYNLFRDASRTSIWGDGTGGTSIYTHTWTIGQPIRLTIYGRVAPGADVSAGTYSDTVTAVINF